MRDVEPAAILAANLPQTSEIYIYLVTFSHAVLDSPIRICNDVAPVISNGHTYLPYGFDYTPPDDRPEEINNGTLSVDAIDRVVVEMVNAVGETDDPLNIEIQEILISDPDTPIYDPVSYTARVFVGTTYTVDMTLEFSFPFDEPIPGATFSRDKFPGLHRT